MPHTCAHHQVLIKEQGGVTLFAELTPVLEVHWNRIRDAISTAEVIIPTQFCCDIIEDLRTVIHELHLVRDGDLVWCGPIVRIEYEHDVVRIFAEDMLWVPKRRVLEVAYNQTYPAVGYVIDRMDWLLRTQCYGADDRWKMVTPNHLHPIHGPDDPRTTRTVPAYSVTIWDDFDKYAEDGGADYCVVGRDIYYFDTQLAWVELPDLDEQYLSQFPTLVEYGNQLATRAFVTNSKGYAGIATKPTTPHLDLYGYVDNLITDTRLNEAADTAPSAGELAQWSATAARNLQNTSPSPLGIVVPANTSLMPGAPWTVDMLIPGAWFNITITRMCRTFTAPQRINEVTVSETADEGENVAFSAINAPANKVLP